MKTFVFCTTFFGVDKLYEEAPWRYPKWIDYYSRNLPAFGADRIFLIDDGSNPAFIQVPGLTVLDATAPLPAVLPPGPILFRFPGNLGRRYPWNPPGDDGFPGWWRSFTFSLEIAEKYGYARMIHAESDLFVISQRLADRIRTTTEGWSCFSQLAYRDWWTTLSQPRRRWDTNFQHWRNRLRYLLFPFGFPVYPEPALQILCRDRFESLRFFLNAGIEFWNTHQSDFTLPFDRIFTDMNGMRYGEYLISHYSKDADYVAQALEPWTFDQTLRS